MTVSRDTPHFDVVSVLCDRTGSDGHVLDDDTGGEGLLLDGLSLGRSGGSSSGLLGAVGALGTVGRLGSDDGLAGLGPLLLERLFGLLGHGRVWCGSKVGLGSLGLLRERVLERLTLLSFTDVRTELAGHLDLLDVACRDGILVGLVIVDEVLEVRTLLLRVVDVLVREVILVIMVVSVDDVVSNEVDFTV